MHNNPYKAPQSNIDTGETISRSVLWKVYFFVITAATALTFIGLFSMESVGSIEYVSMLMWLIATIGLYGFVFRKKIYSRRLWMYYFGIYVTFSVAAYYFLTDLDLSGGMSQTEVLISNTIGWLISLPGYVALYLYSSKSRDIWEKE